MGKEPQPTADVAPPEQPSAAGESAVDRPQEHCLREQVEQWVESDPSLVPDGPSSLLVEPSVLDPAEVQALLADLHALLADAAIGTRARRVARGPLHDLADSLFGAAEMVSGTVDNVSSTASRTVSSAPGFVGTSAPPSGTAYDALPGPARAAPGEPCQEPPYEPHAAPVGRDRRDSKLSPLARLFADDAGAGGPAGHQQGHHLRARRRPGKEARPAPRQAQGSLFGDHR